MVASENKSAIVRLCGHCIDRRGRPSMPRIDCLGGPATHVKSQRRLQHQAFAVPVPRSPRRPAPAAPRTTAGFPCRRSSLSCLQHGGSLCFTSSIKVKSQPNAIGLVPWSTDTAGASCIVPCRRRDDPQGVVLFGGSSFARARRTASGSRSMTRSSTRATLSARRSPQPSCSAGVAFRASRFVCDAISVILELTWDRVDFERGLIRLGDGTARVKGGPRCPDRSGP